MSYLLSSGQIIAGIAILVLWWMTLHFVGRRNGGKPLGAMAFALGPTFFLLWFAGGCVLIMGGLGAF
ncbi:MAG TPA: hypothetical protein VH475_29740 [Tepidisphaeraceae bacterium]|jgi:hypothetical protein